jgi:hypothetical protein
MNLNETIRPWLLACGAQHGNNQAYEFRRPDDSTRQEEPYYVYMATRLLPAQDGSQTQSTKTGYDAHVSAWKQHIHTIQIDLYNTEDGMRELAEACLMAEHNDSIKSIYKNKCSFYQVVDITNETTFDGERVYYHHRLICQWFEGIEYTLDDINGIVETVIFDITVNDPPS